MLLAFKLHRNSKNTEPSRRGFLRALLTDFAPTTLVETKEQRAFKQRACVLALKYGKNEAKLTRIGVKDPVPIDVVLFQVELTGHDATGQACHLKLEVNSESGVVKRYETETAVTPGNPKS